MITAICEQSGLLSSQIDVSALGGGSVPVSSPSGYIIERPTTGVAAIRELLDAFFIDARETGGKLQFVPRGVGQIVQSAQAFYVDPILQTPLAYPNPNAVGATLVAILAYENPSSGPGPALTITDSSGNTWTNLFSNNDIGGNSRGFAVWICTSAIGGANTVTFMGGTMNYQQQELILEIAGGCDTTTATGSSPGTASLSLDGVPFSVSLIGTDVWEAVMLVSPQGAGGFSRRLAIVALEHGNFTVTAPAGWTPIYSNSSTLDVWVQQNVFAIPESDLGLVKDKAKLIESLAQENDQPQAVTILFNDQNLNYLQGKQLKGRNPRIITVATKNQKIVNLPFSLTATQARQIAEAMLYGIWQGRTKYSINLWRALYLLLDPGDWIQFVYEGVTYLARGLSVDAGNTGAVSLQAVSDDPRDYLSDAVGAANDGFTPPTSRQDPNTLLFLLDIPLLRDRDANPNGSGFYAALTSGDPLWLAASLYESIDDTDFTLLDSSDGPVAYGVAQAALAAPASPWDWDTANSLTIQMVSGSLASDSDINVLNGTNALIVGSEIIQFADCVDNGGGSFTISRLLRGRRGTEWACGTHGTFENVIGITIAGGLLREQRPLSEINRTLYYLGVTDGDTVSPPGESFDLTGQDLMPYAPVHIGGSVDGSGNIVITWMRRTRVGWASLSQDPVPLSEDSELYDVDILNSLGAVIRTIANVPIPTATYLASQISTDFGSIPSNGITVNVYQKSAQVGRGFKGTGTVPTPGGWPPPLPATTLQKTFLVNGS